MAVDWINDNLYWADSLYDWIVMAALASHNRYRILIDSGLDRPSGIAVHPGKGLIYIM